MKKNRLKILLLLIVLLLSIPFIAMQFTEQVSWTLFDFILMGLMLLITGLLIEFILRKVSNKRNRITFCIIIFILFLLIWAELGVGLFGTPFSGS